MEEIKKTEETFMDRLVREQNELIEKINKLRGFIDSEKFYSVDGRQQSLLRLQLSAMTMYRDILTERMPLLGTTVTA